MLFFSKLFISKFAVYFKANVHLEYRTVRIVSDRRTRKVSFYDMKDNVVAAFTRSNYVSAWSAAQDFLQAPPSRVFGRALHLGAAIEDGENFYLYMEKWAAETLESEFRKHCRKIKLKEVS